VVKYLETVAAAQLAEYTAMRVFPQLAFTVLQATEIPSEFIPPPVPSGL
jgi:hypothetical protein